MKSRRTTYKIYIRWSIHIVSTSVLRKREVPTLTRLKEQRSRGICVTDSIDNPRIVASTRRAVLKRQGGVNFGIVSVAETYGYSDMGGQDDWHVGRTAKYAPGRVVRHLHLGEGCLCQ
jgi:hypothetical protein